MKKMPTLFIPHGGGPCFFMDWTPADAWDNMADYLKGVPADIGVTPKAMLVISGHWEEQEITVQHNPAPPLLYDYSGFPEHTYKLEYNAPGSPELAMRVRSLLFDAGIKANMDTTRGFDHGVFIPLKVVFPNADIPIVQLSLRADLDPAAHIKVGKALQPLRDVGVLIVGSGMSYHNMQAFQENKHDDSISAPGSKEFDDWLTEAVTNPDFEARNTELINWAQAPSAREAHPREEHLLPLHVVAGAAGTDIGKKMLEDKVLGSIESAFQFG
jgi:aromatic ring-opening dioxygenase catalytic subunit (LigB family)